MIKLMCRPERSSTMAGEVGYRAFLGLYQEWKYPTSNIEGRARLAVLLALKRRELAGDPLHPNWAAKLLNMRPLLIGPAEVDILLKKFSR